MTLLLLVLWVILTRAGSKSPVWPRDLPSSAAPRAAVPLDTTAVSLEAGVAAIALALIPWAVLLGNFATWERVWLVALWPLMLRYALDRAIKLRRGNLVELEEGRMVVPGLPAREVRWSDLEAISVRRVLFGPDDLVFHKGGTPVTIDTQFTTLTEEELVEWALSAADSNVSD